MKKSNPSGSEKGKKKKEEEEGNKASNLIFSTGLYVYSFPLFTLFCFSRQFSEVFLYLHFENNSNENFWIKNKKLAFCIISVVSD